MSSRFSHPGATGGFIAEGWPDTASAIDPGPRLALKLGLILLWSGSLVRASVAFDSSGRQRSVAERGRLEARGVPPIVSLIRDFRTMLSDAGTTVGFADEGVSAWFNWTGRHIPDDERLKAWISPSRYEGSAIERRFSAGQIQEAELDTAMLLIGLALREYEFGHDEPFQ